MSDDLIEQLPDLLPRLRRFAIGLSGSRDSGDDLLQAACERALSRRHQWTSGTRLDSWMYRIIQTLWIDELRRRKRQGETVEAEILEYLPAAEGRNEAETKVLKLMVMASRIGRPVLTPPGVPADRIAALRAAFDAAVSSKAFLAEAKKRRLEINPVSGIEVQKIVKQILATPPELAKLARAAVTKGKVFKCTALVKNKKMCRTKKKKKKSKKSS